MTARKSEAPRVLEDQKIAKSTAHSNGQCEQATQSTEVGAVQSTAIDETNGNADDAAQIATKDAGRENSDTSDEKSRMSASSAPQGGRALQGGEA